MSAQRTILKTRAHVALLSAALELQADETSVEKYAAVLEAQAAYDELTATPQDAISHVLNTMPRPGWTPSVSREDIPAGIHGITDRNRQRAALRAKEGR